MAVGCAAWVREGNKGLDVPLSTHIFVSHCNGNGSTLALGGRHFVLTCERIRDLDTGCCGMPAIRQPDTLPAPSGIRCLIR